MAVSPRLRAVLVAFVLLSGCAQTRVSTDVTRFHQEFTLTPGQTVQVRPVDSGLAGSLEFSLYARALEERLLKLGYVVATTAPPDVVAELAYTQTTRDVTVDSGHAPVSIGIGVGGGSGTFGLGGNLHFPVGSGIEGQSRGFRDTQVLVRLKMGDKPIWEGRVQTTTRTTNVNTLSSLMAPLLEALFDHFPGEPGKTVHYSAPLHR